MVTVAFRNSEARGRNGWFRMASASLDVARGRINVDVVSKRAVCPGPVCLELRPEDATTLAQAMLRQAKIALHPPAPVGVAAQLRRASGRSVRRMGVAPISGGNC